MSSGFSKIFYKHTFLHIEIFSKVYLQVLFFQRLRELKIWLFLVGCHLIRPNFAKLNHVQNDSLDACIQLTLLTFLAISLCCVVFWSSGDSCHFFRSSFNQIMYAFRGRFTTFEASKNTHVLKTFQSKLSNKFDLLAYPLFPLICQSLFYSN